MPDAVYTAELGHAELGALELGGASLPVGTVVIITADFSNAPTQGDFSITPKELAVS